VKAESASLSPLGTVIPTSPGPSCTAQELDELVRRWLTAYPASTRRSYATDLRAASSAAHAQGVTVLDWRTPQLQAYATELSTRLQPASIARRLAALSSFYRYARGEGALQHDPTAGLRRPRVALPPAHLLLHPRELPALLAAAAVHSPRADALVTTLLLTGVRAGELLACDAAALTDNAAGSALAITRKGGRADVVPLVDRALQALHRYLDGRRDGPLLLSRGGRRLGRDGAAALFRAVVTSALGAQRAQRVHLHATRHLFALSCATLGVAPLELAHALGHTGPQHTLRYTAGAQLLEGRHPAAALARSLLGDDPGAS
jgi:site-specific recombinase XerD